MYLQVKKEKLLKKRKKKKEKGKVIERGLSTLGKDFS